MVQGKWVNSSVKKITGAGAKGEKTSLEVMSASGV
jgi:hypothetical protein